MMNNERYPEYIMKYLRLRRGLEEDDTSMDEFFHKRPSSWVFSEILQWKGLLGGWDTAIKGWILDIYGIDLDEFEERK